MSQRRGGGRQRIELESIIASSEDPLLTVLPVNEALEEFAKVDQEGARLVALRYFTGLTIPQAAEALGISRATANRQWAYARAWLHAALERDASADDTSEQNR